MTSWVPRREDIAVKSTKQTQIFLLLAALFFVCNASGNGPRVVDLKTPDGTTLKGSYFAAANPGPSVLLFHQSNRTRKSWDELAGQLAAAGIHVLTVDSRAHGESGGKYDTEANRAAYWKTWWPSDLDTAFQYLSSQSGVNHNIIGAGGAGNLGLQSAIETARRYPAQVKSLVLLSGETVRSGMEFLHQASQLPQLYVMDDNDEYPPTQEEMKMLYITASSPIKQLVHYSQAEDAPWLWYETFLDSGKVPAKEGHGTDMFKPHPEQPRIIVPWFESTLLKTPAPPMADTLASAQVLNQLNFGGIAGITQLKQQLLEARKKDPQAQLFPEVSADSIGEDYQREGDTKTALEVFRLLELAYPQSADVQNDLADAYLANGEKDMARAHAQKALELLHSHAAPASSWSDTEERRGEIRKAAEETLKKTSGKQ
jgi:pimeloyl-ACP methyl ester carboxylesterase